jgi:3-dehydroquinate dehydratase/shikimate dehydrogenase
MSTTLLCATVTATSMADLRRRRDAVTGADLVELRLDGITDLDVDGALAGRRCPVIVTCRPTWQGGRYDGDEAARIAVLERAWDLGAEWVDVEQGAAEAFVRRVHGRRIVRSYHDFAGVPADASARLRELLGSGAEVAKLAVMARGLADVVTARDLAREAAGQGVILAMGPAGLPSRLLAAQLGSRWTYAGEGVAPGQISLERMRDEFRVPAVTASTAVYGLVGHPVGHSLSPAMHNAAFAAAGLDAVYVPLDAASFDDFEAFARAFGVGGVSVTAPYKTDAFAAVANPTPEDRALAAVNTLRRAAGGGWDGRNTDVEGFLAPLADRVLDARRVAVVGAGGAARAVVPALVSRGAAVTVHARRQDAALDLARRTGTSAGAWPPSDDAWDVLVQTTPVGTFPAVEATPLTLSAPLAGRLVYDLVYNPPATALLARARALGAETIGGLPMLVAQAAAQFTWWTGRPAPLATMQEAAVRRLAALSTETDARS